MTVIHILVVNILTLWPFKLGMLVFSCFYGLTKMTLGNLHLIGLVVEDPQAYDFWLAVSKINSTESLDLRVEQLKELGLQAEDIIKC